LLQWVEVGQPDERRLIKASGRAGHVVLYACSASTTIWWAGIHSKLTRLDNLDVWQIPADQSQELAGLCERSMQLQLQVQDCHVWISDAARAVEVLPQPLMRTRRTR
jgi:uncharacterized protein YaeQ